MKSQESASVKKTPEGISILFQNLVMLLKFCNSATQCAMTMHEICSYTQLDTDNVRKPISQFFTN